MSAMASQTTSISIAYATFCSGPEQRKHQSSASLAFVRGIHRWPVNSPHKGPVTRKMFPFDDVIILTDLHEWQLNINTRIAHKRPAAYIRHIILAYYAQFACPPYTDFMLSSTQTSIRRRKLTPVMSQTFWWLISLISHRSPVQGNATKRLAMMSRHGKLSALLVLRDGKSTGYRWIPLMHKGSVTLRFNVSIAVCWTTCGTVGDLRHRCPCDAIVM